MAYKIAFGAGHGGFGVTPGKRTPDGEFEWDFNNKVAIAFEKELKKYNVELKRMDDPTGKTDVPLRTRTNKANAWGADVYISFHHNANTGKWGNWTGTQVHVYKTKPTESTKLAEKVHPVVAKAYGLKDRGIVFNNLHITRETKCTAILIEGGFMDSTIDIKKLRDDKVLEQAGINVAHAVLEYAGIKGKKKDTKKEVKNEAPKHKVKSQSVTKPKANLTVDGKWGPTTTKALQKALGTVADGVISSQPKNSVSKAIYGGITWGHKGSLVIKALQKKIGVKNVDGKLGPDTIRHLQKYLSTPVDGVISRPSSVVVKELQRRLNKGTF